MSTLGERIRAHRGRLGWTQERYAAKFGVSSQVVSNWERNVAEPPAAYFQRIAHEWPTDLKILLDPVTDSANVCAEEKTSSNARQKQTQSAAEAGRVYLIEDSESDERIQWVEELRERYRKLPHEQPKIELAILTALPDQAERILKWMRE